MQQSKADTECDVRKPAASGIGDLLVPHGFSPKPETECHKNNIQKKGANQWYDECADIAQNNLALLAHYECDNESN